MEKVIMNASFLFGRKFDNKISSINNNGNLEYNRNQVKNSRNNRFEKNSKNDSSNRNKDDFIWYRFHNLLLNMPDKKPNLLIGSIYGMSGSAMAWGTHDQGKVYHAEKLKSLINAELSNVGILAALILTIAVAITLSSGASFGNEFMDNLYYCCWAIASIVLAFAVLISVVANIHVTAYETDEELNFLRVEMGLLLHIPLYFLLVGGSLCMAGLLMYVYHQIKLYIFVAICILGVITFSLTTYIFILFVQTAWLAFHPIHGQFHKISKNNQKENINNDNKVHQMNNLN